jgi:hypothetical protein
MKAAGFIISGVVSIGAWEGFDGKGVMGNKDPAKKGCCIRRF